MGAEEAPHHLHWDPRCVSGFLELPRSDHVHCLCLHREDWQEESTCAGVGKTHGAALFVAQQLLLGYDILLERLAEPGNRRVYFWITSAGQGCLL